ncbi:GntR family transcriptional regulator [Fictibacillus sp. UD]|uniref:GntR family transcriptional regulator n=1 Tax=Fictibacillus sp. UD TaxID=3038777 RepID=UPI003745BC9E
MDAFKQVPPLYQQVYDRVKNSILTGEIQPGSKIVVTKLAEQLQISRTPLREALRQLQKEGLLIPGTMGTTVISLNQKHFDELSVCRTILEKEIIKLAVHELSDKQIEEADRVIEESKQALAKQDQLSVLTLNARFHKIIIDACPNKHLIGLLEQVRAKLLLYRANISKKDKINLQTLEEHVEILNALKERDEEKAVEKVEKHSLNDQFRGNQYFKEKVAAK